MVESNIQAVSPGWDLAKTRAFHERLLNADDSIKVCWESGPYQWGCSAFVSGPWGYCETYYGFDLMFVD